MNSRERFAAMMGGGGWDCLPLDLPMTEPVVNLLEEKTGSRDPVTAFGCDFRGIWPALPDRTQEWEESFKRLKITLPHGTVTGQDGYADRKPPSGGTGSAWHLTEMLHPLETLESLRDIENLPWSDPSSPLPYSHFTGQVASIKAEGKVAVLGCECTVFEKAWYCRGMDALFEDIILENGIADFLLDHFTSLSIASCRAAAQAGVDLIRLGDDVGTQRGMMLSVPLWREVLKPRLASVIKAIRESSSAHVLVQYHSDGDIRDILDDLVEIGVDILNPVQPECMPLEEVIPRWKDRLGFSGMIGTQTTMPFGTPEDVRAAVRSCRRFAKEGARIIVAPTHVLEPDVPWENIMALVEEAKEPT